MTVVMSPNMVGNGYILGMAESSIQSTTIKQRSPPAATSSQNGSLPKIEESTKSSADETQKPFKRQIVWRNVYIFIVLHLFALYGIYVVIAERAWGKFAMAYAMAVISGFGVTAGAHRLWAHKSYKAKWPMRLLLMAFQTLAFQNSIYEWVRDHRVHHKFVDTHADPHNSTRGFFFSHMGWLMTRKHPDVIEKGKTIDMSDLKEDPIVVFQERYYLILMPLLCFILPTFVPYYVFGWSFKMSFFVMTMLRYAISLHWTWLVNSAAHLYGTKPYDKSISSSNNKLVSILANGEGWHNYHHIFPWDYKAAELGSYSTNFSTALIDFFAKFGLAYDLKTVSDSMIRRRVQRTGDGSHKYSKEVNNNTIPSDARLRLNHEEETNVWGWDDQDMNEDDRKDATIIRRVDE